MKNKKKLVIVFILSVLLLISIFFVFYNNTSRNIINKFIVGIFKEEIVDSFKIHTYSYNENNNKAVLVTISRINGIDTISYVDKNNKEIVLSCSGKKEIAIDIVPANNTRQAFTIKDSVGNTTIESFIAPNSNIVVAMNTNTQTDIVLENFDKSITSKLDDKLVSSANMSIQVGEAVYQNTNATGASEIFNTWTKYPNLSTVGSANYNANWSLSGDTIRTTADVSWTGYWNKNAANYNQDITISFDSYSGDNSWGDPIGFTFRMTEPSTNVYSFYAVELDHQYNKVSLARITKWDPANQNMSLHSGPIYDMAIHNATGTVLSSVSYSLPTSTWLSTKIEVEDNTIRVYMGTTKVIEFTETDANMLKQGGYGPYVASNPYGYFKNVTISTTKAMTLDEIIGGRTWDTTQINVVVNINGNSENALLTDSTAQMFNNKNIYYVGVGTDTNKSEIQSFISKIKGGIYVNNLDTLESKYTQISDFIAQKSQY